MSLGEYEILEVIGQGGYARVYKVKRKSDGEYLSMKSIPFHSLSPEEKEDCLNECRILREVSHPLFIAFVDSFMEENQLHIIMEYACGGDLSGLIKREREKGKYISEESIWRFLAQISTGLSHLHQKRILHRDIKPSNIFLDRNNNVKIGDLGFGRILSSLSPHATSSVGTPLYFSPEICQDKPYNEKTDVWSLGCLLYELCSLSPPFNASNQLILAKLIVFRSPSPLSLSYSQELRFLIGKMLEKDADKRPTMAQILAYSPVRSVSMELSREREREEERERMKEREREEREREREMMNEIEKAKEKNEIFKTELVRCNEELREKEVSCGVMCCIFLYFSLSLVFSLSLSLSLPRPLSLSLSCSPNFSVSL